MTNQAAALFVLLVLVLVPGRAHADLATDRMTYPRALCGRFEPRQNLPAWMRVPRWCTTDAPRWEEGKTAEPRDECAVGWEQPQEYAWVKARVVRVSPTGQQVDRFLSPGAGMFAPLLHAGVPVKEMHPNHLSRQSLAGFRVLVLANEVCLSDEQCEMIREFVRNGGGLIARHETSLYDLEGKRRADFGLADVFGAGLRGVIPVREGQTIKSPVGGKHVLALPYEGWSNREEHLLVEARDADTCAWLRGPGVPGGRAPALALTRFGDGRVLYLPGRLDSSYSLWADDGFVALVRTAVDWVSQRTLPAQASATEGIVGVTCFDQPSRNRRLVHLVAYDAD